MVAPHLDYKGIESLMSRAAVTLLHYSRTKTSNNTLELASLGLTSRLPSVIS